MFDAEKIEEELKPLNYEELKQRALFYAERAKVWQEAKERETLKIINAHNILKRIHSGAGFTVWRDEIQEIANALDVELKRVFEIELLLRVTATLELTEGEEPTEASDFDLSSYLRISYEREELDINDMQIEELERGVRKLTKGQFVAGQILFWVSVLALVTYAVAVEAGSLESVPALIAEIIKFDLELLGVGN